MAKHDHTDLISDTSVVVKAPINGSQAHPETPAELHARILDERRRADGVNRRASAYAEHIERVNELMDLVTKFLPVGSSAHADARRLLSEGEALLQRYRV